MTASPVAAAPVAAGRHKLASTIAQRIEEDIVAAGWPVGVVVGTELELIDRYSVSRAVLREAIRLVEYHKVARMRRGPSGGLVVLEPDAAGISHALVVFLEHARTSVADLVAVRLVLEPLAVRLTTKRLTNETRSALVAALADEEGSTDLPNRVHHAIAAACGNSVLQLFIDMLEDLSERFAAHPGKRSAKQNREAEQAIRTEHTSLVARIVGGDVHGAEDMATQHLETTCSLLLSSTRNVQPWASHEDSHPNGTGKLAERLADRIRLDLAAAGSQVGVVVGSEDSLRERYGVSRQALREAVRLLEHHGVAVMRRGPGGGLVMTEPDSSASAEAMAIYLDYRKTGIDDLRPVRRALEIACVDRVVDQRRDPDVAARLRQALVDEASPDEPNAFVRAHGLHLLLAELSGNPVLVLFLRILTSLWERHGVQRPKSAPRGAAALKEIGEVHTRIVEAILEGNGELARQRMEQHLESLTAWWQ